MDRLFKELPALERRVSRIKEVLRKKQKDLVVFLDRVRNYHNASAILRTSEAVGVLRIYYTGEGFLPINSGISLGSERWLLVERVSDPVSFLDSLKGEGFKVYVTSLGDDSKDYREVDYTGKTVVVFGNEKEGVSESMLSTSDATIRIPMVGMVRSLNVSVSAGVILYEAMRQREKAGLYSNPSLTEEEMEKLLDKWISLRFLKKGGGSVGS